MSELLIDELVVRLGLDTASLQTEARQTTQLLDKLRQSAEQTATSTRQAGTQASAALSRMRGEAVSLLAILSGGRGLNRLLADLSSPAISLSRSATAPRTVQTPSPQSSTGIFRQNDRFGPPSSRAPRSTQASARPTGPSASSGSPPPASLLAQLPPVAPSLVRGRMPMAGGLAAQPVLPSGPMLPPRASASFQLHNPAPRVAETTVPRSRISLAASSTPNALLVNSTEQKRFFSPSVQKSSAPGQTFSTRSATSRMQTESAVSAAIVRIIGQTAQHSARNSQAKRPLNSQSGQRSGSADPLAPTDPHSTRTNLLRPSLTRSNLTRSNLSRLNLAPSNLARPSLPRPAATNTRLRALNTPASGLFSGSAHMEAGRGAVPRHAAQAASLTAENRTLSRALATLHAHAGRALAVQPYLPGSPLLHAATPRSAPALAQAAPSTTTHIGPVTITVPSGNPHAIAQALQGLGGGDSHTLTSLATIGTV